MDEKHAFQKKAFHVDLPENLRAKFASLERKLFVVDTVIAAGGIVAGLVISWLLLFMADRFWDTPAVMRSGFTLVGLGVAAFYVIFWLKHWVINRRDNRVLAAIVQKEHRRMGDRLMSAVELTDHEQRPEEVSETLCRAAIDQIANDSEKISFNRAVKTRRPLIYTILSVFILGLMALPATYTPDASQNALKRWAMSGEERYTFVQNGELMVNQLPVSDEGKFYVPRGEDIHVDSKYNFTDMSSGKPFWKTLGNWWDNSVNAAEQADSFLADKLSLQTDMANTLSEYVPDPELAKLSGTKTPRYVAMRDGGVRYTLPGRSKPLVITLRMGDVRREISIEPVARPEIEGTEALVQYPKYLGYSPADPQTVNSSVFQYLEGSQVMLRGQLSKPANAKGGESFTQVIAKATRNIGSEVQAQEVEIQGERFNTTKYLNLDDFREMEVTWKDHHHIAGREPWKLIFEKRVDELPHRVECRDKAPVIAILRSEVLEIPMAAEDDYGLKEIKAAWECWSRNGTNLVKKGDSTLATFKPQNLQGSATFLFDPGDKALNLPEGTVVKVFAVAKDYYLYDRERRSLPIEIHILTEEEHAQLIQQNFESKMAELDDLARRQENLLDATRELQDMDPEQLNNDQNDKKLGRQEQEQKNIKDKLKELADDIEELSKEALKNKDMDPTDLAKMAQMAQKMKELADQQMSEAQQSLQQAQESQSQQERKENVEDAAKKEKEALDELKEMQEQANENMQDMYANTLIKRLRKIVEFEEGVADLFKENVGGLIGKSLPNLDAALRDEVNEAFGYQEMYARKAQELQEEISRFYDATNDEKFGEVTKAMASYGPVEKMEINAERIAKVHLQSTIENSLELAKKFTEWADILDPQDDGGGGDGGEGGEGGEPNEDMIARLKELLRLRQAEMDLREKTLNLDAESGVKERAQFEEDAFRLQFRQLELLGDLQIERDARGDGEYLPAAQFRMRDAEDELNLQGDDEGLVEAYKWALVAKAKGDTRADANIKKLTGLLSDRQKRRAERDAKELTDQ